MTFWRLMRLCRQFQDSDQQLRRIVCRSHLFDNYMRNVQQDSLYKIFSLSLNVTEHYIL